MTRIEFYIGAAERAIAILDDGAVPRDGETINIRKIDYLVTRVAWAVDYPDDVGRTSLRANVELKVKPVNPAPERGTEK